MTYLFPVLVYINIHLRRELAIPLNTLYSHQFVCFMNVYYTVWTHIYSWVSMYRRMYVYISLYNIVYLVYARFFVVPKPQIATVCAVSLRVITEFHLFTPLWKPVNHKWCGFKPLRNRFHAQCIKDDLRAMWTRASTTHCWHRHAHAFRMSLGKKWNWSHFHSIYTCCSFANYCFSFSCTCTGMHVVLSWKAGVCLDDFLRPSISKRIFVCVRV